MGSGTVINYLLCLMFNIILLSSFLGGEANAS